jgi:hypothetical protein
LHWKFPQGLAHRADRVFEDPLSMNALIATLLLFNTVLADDWQAQDSCTMELTRMHTVRVLGRTFLLYGDSGLATYLQTVGGNSSATAVVPVYSEEPIAILRDNMVVVSTGQILRSGSETELRAALPRVKPSWSRTLSGGEPPVRLLPSCSSRQAPGSFELHKARLASEISKYRELTAPRLIRRTKAPLPTE